MAEVVTASTVATYEKGPESYIAHPEQLAQLGKTIGQLLVENNIEIGDVLFSGHSDVAKQEGAEHWQPGEDPSFYFGDAKSLKDPRELAADDNALTDPSEIEERQGEHWVANPLNYAMQGGRLSMYKKSQLTPLVDAAVNAGLTDSAGTTDYGTYLVQAPQHVIDSAKIATLNVRTK